MAKERIQKILSRAGLLSRRKAEEAILAGRVRLNGTEVTELGTSADPATDRLELDGKSVVLGGGYRVVLLNKPRMVVTTKSDPQGRKTVMDLLPGELSTLNPVGRLDFGTEGLLLLTDDGELLNRLTHPRYNVEKEYLALVKGRPSDAKLLDLTTGVVLEDGPGRFERAFRAGEQPARATRSGTALLKPKAQAVSPTSRPASASPDDTWVEITVTEGRNRFVRRMLEAVNHPVLRLKRVRQGPIRLGDLQPGQYRLLTAEEIESLEASSRWTER